MNLLHIDSSALGQNSVTRELSAAIVSQWTSTLDGVQVEYRDLDREPLPHLTGGSLAKADPAEAADAERTLQQFLDADVVVIGAPMYNFSIPSTLKAWIDRVAVAGTTFRYGANGPEGLVRCKRVIVAATYGGRHPVESGRNFVEPYLRQVFGFLGIDAVEFVDADSLNVSPEQRTRALEAAQDRIDAMMPARAA